MFGIECFEPWQEPSPLLMCVAIFRRIAMQGVTLVSPSPEVTLPCTLKMMVIHLAVEPRGTGFFPEMDMKDKQN